MRGDGVLAGAAGTRFCGRDQLEPLTNEADQLMAIFVTVVHRLRLEWRSASFRKVSAFIIQLSSLPVNTTTSHEHGSSYFSCQIRDISVICLKFHSGDNYGLGWRPSLITSHEHGPRARNRFILYPFALTLFRNDPGTAFRLLSAFSFDHSSLFCSCLVFKAVGKELSPSTLPR